MVNLLFYKLPLFHDEGLPFFQAFIAQNRQPGIFADTADGHARIFQAAQHMKPLDIFISKETDAVHTLYPGEKAFLVIIADGGGIDSGEVGSL